MCATYGLEPADEYQLACLNAAIADAKSQEALERWQAQRHGTAKITGAKAVNLNPLVTATASKPADDDSRSLSYQFHLAWWWLHLGGEPAPFSAFNARDDKLLSSRAWRGPFRNHRAIAPASWYIEKGRRFALPSGEDFGIATITAPSAAPDGSEMLSYALVTRDAVAEAASVHPRMPLILPQELHEDWLDPSLAGDGDLLAEALTASEQLSHEIQLVG